MRSDVGLERVKRVINNFGPGNYILCSLSYDVRAAVLKLNLHHHQMSLKDRKLKEVFLIYVNKNCVADVAISGVCRTSGVPEIVFSTEWNAIPFWYHGVSTKCMDRPNYLICYLIVLFPL
jgi:hypothetical protein